MANGLFATRNIGTPGEIQRLMQLEQEKRIRDAGAGFSNPLIRARAMAGQGMQEAISGMGTGLTGLLEVRKKYVWTLGCKRPLREIE